MSLTTPTVTPKILTGLPSASPATVSRRTLYSFFREKIFCSDPMKNRNIISTTAAAVTSAPTRMVLCLVLVAMVYVTNRVRSVNISVTGLGRGHHTRLEELPQNGMVGIAGVLHCAH